jgi:NAD(P)-dependent dehydrogenase (short-subunit alcohol dehydrogenase family)
MSVAANFRLDGRVIVVTGGYGVIGGTIARGLAAAGARVVVMGRNADAATALVTEIAAAGGAAMAVTGDVLDETQVAAARDAVIAAWGQVDALVNAAGGNVARARSDGRPVFDVPMDAFEEALKLNLHGSIVPTLVFGATMAARKQGSIVCVSSMASTQAISGVLGYSVAKAGIDVFTKWMGTELARRYGDGLRVNAIAPGFFVTTQNRSVLINADGSLTPRSRRIIDRTPMGRFGNPEELVGAVHWLCSDAASFVTGVVVPVDGGFSAFSGV